MNQLTAPINFALQEDENLHLGRRPFVLEIRLEASFDGNSYLFDFRVCVAVNQVAFLSKSGPAECGFHILPINHKTHEKVISIQFQFNSIF